MVIFIIILYRNRCFHDLVKQINPEEINLLFLTWCDISLNRINFTPSCMIFLLFYSTTFKFYCTILSGRSSFVSDNSLHTDAVCCFIIRTYIVKYMPTFRIFSNTNSFKH
ncbi:hypothetical protein CV102_17665 [Natronococcus pandeyae]|uniref:Uncharacterized protein n=1 Tax=Natronococcus pandeyae TaxID=2055836 RepID=A0A8J8TR75_9EURY|nr:hypothetical protein CV102_17665 [Natronococcus pandeyae]